MNQITSTIGDIYSGIAAGISAPFNPEQRKVEAIFDRICSSLCCVIQSAMSVSAQEEILATTIAGKAGDLRFSLCCPEEGPGVFPTIILESEGRIHTGNWVHSLHRRTMERVALAEEKVGQEILIEIGRAVEKSADLKEALSNAVRDSSISFHGLGANVPELVVSSGIDSGQIFAWNISCGRFRVQAEATGNKTKPKFFVRAFSACRGDDSAPLAYIEGDGDSLASRVHKAFALEFGKQQREEDRQFLEKMSRASAS